ncbi:hypothetical protein [Nocardia sp. IFM 10818]
MTADVPVVMSFARYFGSKTRLHGDGYLVVPCPGFDHIRCHDCLYASICGSAERRYALVDLRNPARELRHVREESFTVHPVDWPRDAVPVEIRGFRYMVSDIEEAPGMPGLYTVRFHTAEGPVATSHTLLDARTLRQYREHRARNRPIA